MQALQTPCDAIRAVGTEVCCRMSHPSQTTNQSPSHVQRSMRRNHQDTNRLDVAIDRNRSLEL
jgi:hypothetical protein